MKRENYFSIWVLFIVLAVLLLVFSKFGLFEKEFFLEKTFFNLQSKIYQFFNEPLSKGEEGDLKKENRRLFLKIVEQKKLEEEIAALKDQFQISAPVSQRLMSAKIIGAPSFIPGLSEPENLIIDKGTKDHIYLGQPVIVGNNLVGKITAASFFVSKIDLLINKSISVIGKTQETGAIGLVKGSGSEIILDNVLLSDNLAINDVVLTKGEITLDGKGVPGNLIIGKIISIEKKPSALFQKAGLKSSLDLTRLSTVFLITPVSQQ